MKQKSRSEDSSSTRYPELDSAIRDIYSAFGRHRAPEHTLDVCLSCCVDPKIERELRELPLRSLSAHHFYEYNASAKGETQPVDEVKYLLPRLLELLAHREDLHHSTELYLDRLGRCDPTAFTAREREAIQRFALVHFQVGLEQWPIDCGSLFMGENALTVLLMWDIGGVDVSPLLAHWLACEREAATLHYIDASHWDFWRDGGAFNNPFAGNREAIKEQLHKWMTASANRRLFAQRILSLVGKGLPNHGYPASCYADLRQRADEVFDAIAD